MNEFTNGVTITPLAMFEVITHPAFTSLLPEGEGAYDGVLGDFIVLDDVPNKRPVIDITPTFNILMREDTSCTIVYKRVGTTALRYIETDEIYGATQNCRHEFYQGALKDFRNSPEVFADKITPFFLHATRTDVASNAWFGDTTRTNTGALTFSSTIFNGIWKWIGFYTGNLIPSAQIFTPLATNYRDPAHYVDAFHAIDAAWQLQPVLLRAYNNAAKVIYCDLATLEGFTQYQKLLGTESDTIVKWLGSAVTFDSYHGIAIVPVPLWEPILNGDIYTSGYHHAVILTMRKNFIFATDKTYGEGPDGDQALNIWYYPKDRSWYYQQFLKAGTQIMIPEFVVAGMN